MFTLALIQSPSWPAPSLDPVKPVSQLLLGAALIVIAAGIGAAGAGGAGALLGAVGLLLAFEVRGSLWSARRLEPGLPSGELARSRLRHLEEAGWLIGRGLREDCGEQVVHSPAVTFVIETMTTWPRRRDIENARRQAFEAAARYGSAREVVSVVCVADSEESLQAVAGVSVCGASHLLDFLLDRG